MKENNNFKVYNALRVKKNKIDQQILQMEEK